jgi:hypothetical protein
MDFPSVQDRLNRSFNYLKLEGVVKTQIQLAQLLKYDKATVSHALGGSPKHLTPSFVTAFCKTFRQINENWILTGEGNMVHSQEETANNPELNLIPFYDDITTIGGMNNLAESGAVYKPTEYINTGDWFRDATAALRHYGDSMVEYPSGCILALKEVKDKSLLIWGEDYVIETSEYRITKKVQRGSSKEFVTAYSTNTETYPDGRQIHEPIDIPIDSARFLLVLGYVVKKKNGGMMVFSKDNN